MEEIKYKSERFKELKLTWGRSQIKGLIFVLDKICIILSSELEKGRNKKNLSLSTVRWLVVQHVHRVCHWKWNKYTFEQLLWSYCNFLEYYASLQYVIVTKWNMFEEWTFENSW